MSKRDFTKARTRSYRERVVEERELRARFLIVCEGEETEPNYFKNFRVPKDIIDIHGLGYNTISLVHETMRLESLEEYTQVWCVFDRDSFKAKDFNNALILAEQNDIKVAYSNQAFELWFLLHFNYYNTGMHRSQYKSFLKKLLGKKYKKNSRTMYDDLLPLQDTAIRYAQQLLAEYNPHRPEKDNPSTTVHLLVQELNKFSS